MQQDLDLGLCGSSEHRQQMCPSLISPSVSRAFGPFMVFFSGRDEHLLPCRWGLRWKMYRAGRAEFASAGLSASHRLISQPFPVYLKAILLC